MVLPPSPSSPGLHTTTFVLPLRQCFCVFLHCTSDTALQSQSRSSKPGSTKRLRVKATADMDDADDEEAFLQKQQQRKRGSSRGGSSGSSGGLLAEMMRAALEAGVAQLIDMGYRRSKALDALKECNCDVELAVEYLATICC